MKNIFIITAFTLCFISCKETSKSIEIENYNTDIPITLVYNSRAEKIITVIFPFTFHVNNSSRIKRKISDTYYVSNNRRRNKTFRYLDEDCNYTDVTIKKGNLDIIVSQKAFDKKDTILSMEDLTQLPDTVYLHGQDTIKRYKYKTISQLQKEHPEFLDFYIKKTDSIRFEFDDSELPFYVKRSYYKDTLDGQVFEGKLERPFITVPVLGK